MYNHLKQLILSGFADEAIPLSFKEPRLISDRVTIAMMGMLTVIFLSFVIFEIDVQSFYLLTKIFIGMADTINVCLIMMFDLFWGDVVI